MRRNLASLSPLGTQYRALLGEMACSGVCGGEAGPHQESAVAATWLLLFPAASYAGSPAPSEGQADPQNELILEL